jgi:hypothetical protein
VVVAYRMLHRFCGERCGFGRTASAVRVADGEPGAECQLDFGYLGLLADPATGRQRKVHTLIFTAVYSRHMFVWLSFTRTLARSSRGARRRGSGGCPAGTAAAGCNGKDLPWHYVAVSPPFCWAH